MTWLIVAVCALTAAFALVNPQHARSATIAEIAKKFAPVVFLHEDEQFFPSSVGWFLDRACLQWAGEDVARGKDYQQEGNEVGLGGCYTDNALSGYAPRIGLSSGPNAYRYRFGPKNYPAYWFTRPFDESTSPSGSLKRGSLPASTGWSLDLDDAAWPGLIPSKQTGRYDGGAPAYWEWGPAKQGGYWITYWFFYANNELSVDKHEGDWERISIRFASPQDKPVEMYSYSHNDNCAVGAGTIPWKKTSKWYGTHPAIFSSLGGHASYNVGSFSAGYEGGVSIACEGWQQELGEEFLGPLDTIGLGTYWETGRNLVQISDRRPGTSFTPPTWWGFGGAWGEARPGPLASHITGPSGPGWKPPSVFFSARALADGDEPFTGDPPDEPADAVSFGALDDVYTVWSGTTLKVPAPGVLSNDTLSDGSQPSKAKVESIDFGASEYRWGPSGSALGDGSFTYLAKGVPAGSSKTISYVAMAPNGTKSNRATATIKVVENPNKAEDDAYEVPWGTTLNVAAPGVLANDTMPDGSKPVKAKVTSISFGTSEYKWGPSGKALGDGSFQYFAKDVPVGQVKTIKYVAIGADGTQTNEATATVTVVDNPNKAQDDSYQVAAGERLVIPAPGVLMNDVLPNGGTPTTAKVTSISFGASEYRWGGTGAAVGDGSFAFFAKDVPVGQTKTIKYIAIGADGEKSNEATVTIGIVEPRNRSDTYRVRAGESFVLPAPGVLVNDAGPGQEQPVAARLDYMDFGEQELIWGPSDVNMGDGSFTLIAGDGASGLVKTMKYTPILADGYELPQATIRVVILKADAPSFALNACVRHVRTISALLPDGVSSWELVTQNFSSAGYQFDWRGNGTFGITPPRGAGVVSFAYRVYDPSGMPSNTATVTIDHSNISDCPGTAGTTMTFKAGVTHVRSLSGSQFQLINAPSGLSSWNLKLMSFSGADYGFTWRGDGSFEIKPKTTHANRSVYFDFSITNAHGIESNVSRVTINFVP